MADKIIQTDRTVLETKFKNSRMNLLLVVIFTTINVVLLVTQSNSYFLFSAFVPYMIADLGMLLCGKYPAEYYGEDIHTLGFYGDTVFVMFIAITLIVTALYLLCWLCSKSNKTGWLIFALVLFAIDTVMMLVMTEIGVDSIIDIVFHVWVLVSLVTGIISGNKLKKLPIEPVEAIASEVISSEGQTAESVAPVSDAVVNEEAKEADPEEKTEN